MIPSQRQPAATASASAPLNPTVLIWLHTGSYEGFRNGSVDVRVVPLVVVLRSCRCPNPSNPDPETLALNPASWNTVFGTFVTPQASLGWIVRVCKPKPLHKSDTCSPETRNIQ